MQTQQLTNLLEQAKTVYSQDIQDAPIKTQDYLSLLECFDRLQRKIHYQDSYDTDFRRNLPGGAWRGLRVAPNMTDRVNDAREYAQKHPVYAPTGESIIQNIIACVHIATRSNVDLVPMITPTITVLKAVAGCSVR